MFGYTFEFRGLKLPLQADIDLINRKRKQRVNLTRSRILPSNLNQVGFRVAN